MTALLDSPFVAHMERYHPDSVTARLAVECRRLGKVAEDAKTFGVVRVVTDHPLCEGCPCLFFDPAQGHPCKAEIAKLREERDDAQRSHIAALFDFGKDAWNAPGGTERCMEKYREWAVDIYGPEAAARLFPDKETR